MTKEKSFTTLTPGRGFEAERVSEPEPEQPTSERGRKRLQQVQVWSEQILRRHDTGDNNTWHNYTELNKRKCSAEWIDSFLFSTCRGASPTPKTYKKLHYKRKTKYLQMYKIIF